MRRNWILVDLDDTIGGVEINGEIVGSTDAYQHTLAQICFVMEQEVGCTAREFLQLHDELDVAAHKKRGFSDLSVFPGTCLEAFERLCCKVERKVSDEVANHILNLAWGVYKYPLRALPGAVETLAVLRNYYKIAVVTKGQDAFQRNKLYEMGLFPYVDHTVVLAHKSYEEWEDVIHNRLRIGMNDRALSWAIGNSIKSDINPPLYEGLNAIHVDGPTWKSFEDGELEKVQDGRVFERVPSIRDVLKIVPFPIG